SPRGSRQTGGRAAGTGPAERAAVRRHSMKAVKIVLALVLVDFLALTSFVLAEHGFVGFYRWALHNSATTLMLVDLCISLVLVMVWMLRDARERGVSVLPYVLITRAIGSAGPLLYLLRRESDAPRLAQAPAR